MADDTIPNIPPPHQFTIPMPAPSSPGRYSNAVFVTASQWDFTLSFGQMIPGPPPGPDQPPQVQYLPVETLVMSPQHTKAFLEILRKNVENWEKQFSEIEVSTDVAQGEED